MPPQDGYYDDEYDDEYGDYEDYYDDDYYGYDGRVARQAVDWGMCGSIVVILLLTALYICSPLDFIPDIIPVAGQADDIVALLAGGGSATMLALIRYVLRSRIGRWGCFIAIVVMAISALVIFYALILLFDTFLA